MEKNKNTSKKLAEKLYEIAASQSVSNSSRGQAIRDMESLIEPHIRKPSDDEWMKNAAFLLQKAITSYNNTKSVNTDEIRRFLNKGTVTADMEWVEENIGAGKTSTLESDIEWLTRGCMRIMRRKTNGDINAYRELKEFISQKVSPTSPETNSVPERCKEAYNEAVALLGLYNQKLEEDEPLQYHWKLLFDSVAKFLKKPNPFKEADIVQDEKPEPQLLPFDLGLAAQGHKVVTRDGREAKIVAEGLKGVTPICSIITNHDGSKIACLQTLKGELIDHKENPEDLFILKEPETVYIDILRQEDGALYTCLYKDVDETYPIEHGTDIIKTITVTI